MSYLDDLRPASFRGVPFLVESGGAQGGKRLVTHQYPNRRRPDHEELGLKDRPYDFNAFLIGDDAVFQAERLIRACERTGPGELVHSLFGEAIVQCQSWAVSFDTAGRQAKFTLSFVREEPGFLTLLFENPFIELLELANEAASFAANLFELAYRVTDPRVVENILGITRETVAHGERIASAVLDSPELLDNVRKTGIRLTDEIESLAEKPGQIVAGFQEFSGRLRAGLEGEGVGEDRTLEVHRDTKRFRSEKLRPGASDPGVLAHTVFIGAELTALELALLSENETLRYPEGRLLVRDVSQDLDGLSVMAGDAGNGELAEQFRIMRINFAGAVREASGEHRTTRFAPDSPVPAIVATYDRFGSLGPLEDLTRRNRPTIDHPGFLAPGQPVDVLAEDS